MKGLLDGSLNARNPDLSMIAQQNEKPAGIYVWCVHARGVLAGGMPLTVEKFTTKLYRDIDVYARAATVHGLQLMQTMGFEPNATFAGITSTNVHVYRALENFRNTLPIYDDYQRPCSERSPVGHDCAHLRRHDANHVNSFCCVHGRTKMSL